uniref:Uncharacterized protein n=1 Tax=Romanomermis culicivorax TaxID=13658 RepID=A0A915KEN9_ROMCU
MRQILLPPIPTAPAAPHPVQIAQRALIVAQTAPHTVAADHCHGCSTITDTEYLGAESRLPCRHSVKRKTQQQEEVEHPKAHKTRTMDEPHARRTPPPCTSRPKRGKMPSKCTTRRPEQRAQQKARQTAVQPSSTTGWTAQPKVTTTKSSATGTTSAKPMVLPQQMRPFHHSHSHCSRHKLHHRDDRHHKATEHSPPQDTATRICRIPLRWRH